MKHLGSEDVYSLFHLIGDAEKLCMSLGRLISNLPQTLGRESALGVRTILYMHLQGGGCYSDGTSTGRYHSIGQDDFIQLYEIRGLTKIHKFAL